VDGIQPGVRRCVKALASAAPDLFVRGADVDYLAHGRVGDPEDLIDGFGDLAEFLLTLAQRMLRLFPRGDVPGHVRYADGAAAGIMDRRGGDGHINQRPALGLSPRLFSWLAGWGAVPFAVNGWGWLTVYILAPLAGGLLGGGIYRLFFRY